jgi:enterochelin esterase family protein
MSEKTAGTVKEFNIQSKVYGKQRRFWVYTPAGYKTTAGDAYNLMVVFDGEDFQKDIPLPRILDSLSTARAIPPFVAVMIDNGSGAARLNDLANNPPFAAFLSGEVVPWVRQHFNVTRDPQRTIIGGSSAGGLGAAYNALVHPELFGNVLSLSGAFWRGYAASNDPPYEWLAGQYAAQPRHDVRFFMDVGALETRRALGSGPVFIDATRRFRDALRSKGYKVVYTEVPGGNHSPESWVQQLPAGIVALSR